MSMSFYFSVLYVFINFLNVLSKDSSKQFGFGGDKVMNMEDKVNDVRRQGIMTLGSCHGNQGSLWGNSVRVKVSSHFNPLVYFIPITDFS